MSTSTSSPSVYPAYWIMLLGIIVAIGPLSIDMYLPALPQMAHDFGIDTARMAISVPAYFVGLVVGQLVYGPVSDRIGRIRPLYFGLSLYVVASILCATAPNEYVLFAARTLQALGACVGTVVPRAMIRDRLTPTQMARAFSLLVLVMGLAPILAPSLGALLLQFGGWRLVFWVLAGVALILLAITHFYLTETLPAQRRNQHRVKQVVAEYLNLLRDPRFNYAAIGAGLLMGSMFVYISTASELIMVHYGVSATHFSWIFGMNAAGFIAMTQVNQRLIRRYALVSLLRAGALMQSVAALILLSLGLIWGTQAWLPLVIGCIFSCLAALGITQPNAGALALAFQKQRAGTASALQGSLNFMVGIFGGVLSNSLPLNAVTRLGLTMSVLMVLGTLLIYRIDPALNLQDAD